MQAGTGNRAGLGVRAPVGQSLPSRAAAKILIASRS
jgi:hypothetical protein